MAPNGQSAKQRAQPLQFSRSTFAAAGVRRVEALCGAEALAFLRGQQALLAQIPLGRLGEAKEVAEAVAFLAGPNGGYVTGSELHVNGGMYMC